MPVVTSDIAKLIDRLESGRSLNVKLKKIIEGEIRRRLAEYQLIEQRLSKKYGMSLAKFEEREVIKKKKYSFEVETDYHEWDMAVDGIKSLKQDLKRLKEKK